MKIRMIAVAAAVLALVGCGSSSPSLTWTCSVTSGNNGFGIVTGFTATVTAHNPGTTPVTVNGYTVVLYNTAGQEIFSGDWVLNGTIEPRQSLSGTYERGSVLDQAPATCQVPRWSAG